MLNLYYVPNGDENMHVTRTRHGPCFGKVMVQVQGPLDNSLTPNTLETNTIFHFP